MIEKKIVFFEELRGDCHSILNEYLKKEFLVFYYSINRKYAERKQINKLIRTKMLINFHSKILKYEIYPQAACLAHKNLDYIFNKYFSQSPSVKEMTKLLDFPEISDMYKKELLIDLEKLYGTELIINEIVNTYEFTSDVHFIPKSHFMIHSDKTSPLIKGITLIRPNNFRVKLKNFVDHLKRLLLLLYPIYLLFIKIKGISNQKLPRRYKIGITINHPKSLFGMNYYTETIFIDDNEMPKEDVLFIDESGKININGYKKNGYKFTLLKNDRESLSADFFWNGIIKSFLPTWFKTLIWSIYKEPYFIDTKRRILQDYILWNIFVQNYEISNYLRKLLPDNLSKTHILSQNGIKTWNVHSDNSTIDPYLEGDMNNKNQTIYSFMHYDKLIVYGEITKRFIKKHRNKIKEYVKNGIIYSQIVNEIQNGKLKSALPSIIIAKKLPKIIIGVFDTSYGVDAQLRPEDGIQFGKNILKLLDEFPDIGIVFKAKKELELTPFLIPLYKELIKHERCLFFARYNEEGISAPEVITVSDLSISAAFTSTTAEALGAKKKGIYYDVAGNYIGEGFYYNRIPNFVAHSYEELKKLINYWLHEVTENSFNEFLNTYFKDEIDPYFDGKALTRVRKLFMENDS
ncbi:polysaccharide biosynthesis PFTS motif protein [Candidatus Pacearchaeota archaeon]|nr:polysaccharide biosynthesis PFTS motif protein [Candidatus Pacearchaeota archaeon]